MITLLAVVVSAHVAVTMIFISALGAAAKRPMPTAKQTEACRGGMGPIRVAKKGSFAAIENSRREQGEHEN